MVGMGPLAGTEGMEGIIHAPSYPGPNLLAASWQGALEMWSTRVHVPGPGEGTEGGEWIRNGQPRARVTSGPGGHQQTPLISKSKLSLTHF